MHSSKLSSKILWAFHRLPAPLAFQQGSNEEPSAQRIPLYQQTTLNTNAKTASPPRVGCLATILIYTRCAAFQGHYEHDARTENTNQALYIIITIINNLIFRTSCFASARDLQTTSLFHKNYTQVTERASVLWHHDSYNSSNSRRESARAVRFFWKLYRAFS